MKKKILWIDDEADNLRSMMYFLETEGFDVETVSNGADAIELTKKHSYDLVFLDQYMPGMDGIETLSRIRENSQNTPIIMVTKADDKSIIDSAISERVDDYLIKPVNPLQMLATIKRITEKTSRIKENLGRSYSSTIRRMNDLLESSQDSRVYADIHHTMSQWNLRINREMERDLMDMHSMQKSQLNSGFSKFIYKNYRDWLHGSNAPVMSHTLLDKHVMPLLRENKKVFFIFS